MMRIAIPALLSLLTALSAVPAAAEGQCSERRQVLDYLANEYRERPTAVGVANNGGMVEILSSGEGASWTILVTTPDGRTCMVAAGDEWHSLPLVVTKAEPGA